MLHVSVGGGGGRGVVFQMGAFIFKWGMLHRGGSSVLMGFFFSKKIVGWGGAPLWETLPHDHMISKYGRRFV